MADNKTQRVSRRNYLKGMFAIAGAVVGGSVLSACSKEDKQTPVRQNLNSSPTTSPTSSTSTSSTTTSSTSSASSSATTTAKETKLTCTDISGLTAKEKQTRASSNYVEESPMAMADMDCTTCKHFVKAKKKGTCGTCHEVPGPINPKGFCNLWEQA